MSAAATMADRELVRAQGSGRDSAFAALFERHYADVYRLALVLMRERSHAQDVAQETFITAWRHWGRIRIVNASALPWLLVVCRNQARNQLRSRSRNLTMRDDEIESRVAAERIVDVAALDEMQWFLTQLGLMSHTDRRVIELCLVDGLTYAQAAETLGISRAAVGKRLERMRSWLRRQRDSIEEI